MEFFLVERRAFPDNPNKGCEDDVLRCVFISAVVEILCFYALICFVQFRKEWLIVSQDSFTWFAPVCWFVPLGLASKSVTQATSWAIIRGIYAYSDVIGGRLAPFLHGLHALLGKRHLYRAQRFITCDWQIPGCQVRFTILQRVTCVLSLFISPHALRLLARGDLSAHAREFAQSTRKESEEEESEALVLVL